MNELRKIGDGIEPVGRTTAERERERAGSWLVSNGGIKCWCKYQQLESFYFLFPFNPIQWPDGRGKSTAGWEKCSPPSYYFRGCGPPLKFMGPGIVCGWWLLLPTPSWTFKVQNLPLISQLSQGGGTNRSVCLLDDRIPCCSEFLYFIIL